MYVTVNGRMTEEDKSWLTAHCKNDTRKTQINFITDAIAEKIAKEKRKAK